MGSSIIVKGADFSSVAIPDEDTLSIYKSALKVRALIVDASVASMYGGLEEQIYLEPSTYNWYSYCVPVSKFTGRQIILRFFVGYDRTILGNGGFLTEMPNGLNFLFDGWSPSGRVSVDFISVVGNIESSEANTWVSKSYTIPQGAKYLVFTSKIDTGGKAGAELVEEVEP